jgi:endothelin-converting enzyme
VLDPSQLNNREKVLAILVLALLAIAGTFIGLFAGTEVALKKERAHHNQPPVTTTVTRHHPAPTGKPPKPVCTTAECVTAAAEIIRSINASADPCDDFYAFANGGWLDANSIPADRGIYGQFNSVSDRNKKTLLKIIESINLEGAAFDAETDNLRKLKDTYTSCMDIDKLNERGAEPLVPLIKEVVRTIGTFDVNPMPESESLANEAFWAGSYTPDYVVPEWLRVTAITRKDIAHHLRRAGQVEAPPKVATLESDEEEVEPARKQKITKALAFLHARGVDTLLNFIIEGDAGGDNSQIQSLYFYQSFGGLPAKEYYKEKPILDLYQSVISGILKNVAEESLASNGKRDIVADILQEVAQEATEEGWPWPWPGGDKDDPVKTEPLDKRMDKLAVKVVDFERKIAEAGADPEYLFNPHFSYNPYTAKEVQKALPFIDLGAYLSAMAPRKYPSKIVVSHPPYLKKITKLVRDVPDHVLSAYFVSKLALAYGPALGPKTEVRKQVMHLNNVLSGVKPGTEENRENNCLNAVDNLVGFIAGREFVQAAFSPEAKADGEHIINSIVQAFYDKLPRIMWMDEKSAMAAQKKAKAIIPKVGYPLSPNTTDPNSIRDWYQNVQIVADDYFGNVLGSEIMDNRRAWLTLGRERNRNSWEMYPQTVNAYYSPPDGEIVFPAGILQPPFYSYDWPSHLKYGAFGAVAAHELTHAFDNSGAQYDEHGRLRDWWTNKTVKAFEERAQCVSRQYSKYFVVDDNGNKVYVNGNLTNGEDIADSGLAQAYAAWKADSKHAQKLPGLDFTPEQLFFISFGRIWATLARPATAVSRVRTDPHSPPYWRVIGTLRDNDAFHKAFNCQPGSPMNPPKSEQCQLW